MAHYLALNLHRASIYGRNGHTVNAKLRVRYHQYIGQQATRLAQGMALYECRWFNPEFLGKRCYRFVIKERMEGDKLYSEIFGGNILVDGM